MRTNLYLETAKYYDGGNFRNFSEDILMYKSFIKDDFQILDVGCGTGRVALELINQKVKIVGIDLSKSMLYIFRAKLSKQNQELQHKVEILELDMTNFELDSKFDLILFPFRVFQALTSNEQRVNCLTKMKKHLKETGKMIINCFDPDHKMLESFDKINKLDYEYYDEKLKANIKRSTIGEENDVKNKIIRSKYIFEAKFSDGSKTITEEQLLRGYLEKNEMDDLFKENGLKVIDVYSWWDFSKYISEIKRELIYILSKQE